jgi:hypothetical protein
MRRRGEEEVGGGGGRRHCPSASSGDLSGGANSSSGRSPPVVTGHAQIVSRRAESSEKRTMQVQSLDFLCWECNPLVKTVDMARVQYLLLE